MKVSHGAIFTRAFLASASIFTFVSTAIAQSSDSPSGGNSLPPVRVEAPKQRQAKPTPARPTVVSQGRSSSRHSRHTATRATPSVATAPGATPRETAYGHVDGYVATRSATGTKTDTPLIETPQSISVVTRDQIEAQEAGSTKQALRYTAGVAGENRSNFGGFDIMYSRGFILDQYLDGMRLQGSTAVIATPQPELYGMERVEVLRGPASMLFGQSSPAGLVNLVSKRPSDVSSNEVVLQGGSYDRIQGGFDSTGKIDKNGDFLYRITGFAKDADNQVNYVKEQRYYIAPALTWHPDNQTTWTVMANYQKDPSTGYYNFVPFNGSLGSNPLGRIPTSFYAGDPNFDTSERTQYGITSLFEHKFTDVFTFRENVRYLETTGTLNQVFPLFLANNLFANGDYDTLSRYAQATRERLGAFTSDTQGEFNFDTGIVSHKVLIGFDNQTTSYDQKLAQASQFTGSPGSAPDISLFNPTYGFPIQNPFDDPNALTNTSTHQTLQQNGVYGQEQMKIGGLSIVGGLRYDMAHSNTNTLDRIASTTDGVGQSDQATTGRIGAIYEFASGIAPYVTYATSFTPNVGTTSAFAPLKPTTGELYEGGVKYQPKGSRIFIQASIFDLTEQNVLTIDPVDPTFRSQIGAVHTQGFEIEGKASLTDRLDLIGSFTHMKATVTNSLDIDLGKRPTWIPNDIGALWADYTFRGGSLNGFGAALGIRYTGQTWGDPGNTLLDVPSYTLVDAALHYELENLDRRFKGMRFSVNATNLFDRIYVSQCTVQAFDNACVYGLRRQVLASLRYRW
ncbi:TonB-dependent siderophore receptor [Bradyrhizobium sp. dw_411]|uniref:TonB-dependent siderophore receptor n=1 Tax=Bradyrhizobium sp. dw_411 TaxID=2720082 RepID=UPI001BD00E85